MSEDVIVVKEDLDGYFNHFLGSGAGLEPKSSVAKNKQRPERVDRGAVEDEAALILRRLEQIHQIASPGKSKKGRLSVPIREDLVRKLPDIVTLPLKIKDNPNVELGVDYDDNTSAFTLKNNGRTMTIDIGSIYNPTYQLKLSEEGTSEPGKKRYISHGDILGTLNAAYKSVREKASSEPRSS